MHQHRLVLNGPADAVARLASELESAGAVAVSCGVAGRPRMVWETTRPTALAGLCADHRAVTVGVERFELLGEELERLVLRGGEATVLERRRPVPSEDDDVPPDDGCGGLCLTEEGAPLDPALLRAAARRVLAVPIAPGPAPATTALDDARLLSVAIGRLGGAASGEPDEHALDAVAALAAVALSVGEGSADAAEHRFERAWRLTRATAHAGREELWARPGAADWTEWLMELLASAADVIHGAAACLHAPPAPFVSLHTEHYDTEEEQLERAGGRLASTALQTLVLFDAERAR